MAYDAARHLTVLYGGYGGVGELGDTWEWNGSQWTNPSASSPAGIRWYHGMVFNAGLGRVVSVGGVGTYTDPPVRTWQWTGTTWTVAGTPPVLPPGRWFSAMAYDSQRQRVVMYGGSFLADTWEFDGTNWLRRSITGPPGPRYAHSMAYDSVRGATVLFGGASGQGYLGDTWEWDGAAWSLASNTGPGALSGAPMDFDSDRGVCVLYRGNSAQPQTWEWDGAE
jgi:hypothetical protein